MVPKYPNKKNKLLKNSFSSRMSLRIFLSRKKLSVTPKLLSWLLPVQKENTSMAHQRSRKKTKLSMKKNNVLEMKGKESLINRSRLKKKGTSKRWLKLLNEHNWKNKKRLLKNNSRFTSKLGCSKIWMLLELKNPKPWLCLLLIQMKISKIIWAQTLSRTKTALIYLKRKILMFIHRIWTK